MRKFEVQEKKDLKIGGYGGRYFKPGDVVNENDFIPGCADTLVANGDLKEIKESEEKPADSEENTVNTERDEIAAKLTEMGVPFKGNLGVAKLQALLDSELVKVAETVTDETVTDETVTDETVTDETVTDETVTDETDSDTGEEIDILEAFQGE